MATNNAQNLAGAQETDLPEGGTRDINAGSKKLAVAVDAGSGLGGAREKGNGTVTFRTCDKEPNKVDLRTPDHYLKSLVEYRKEGCGTTLDQSLRKADRILPTNNGFVWTVVEAYNQHHNLVLRPDDVWLAIMVQFSAFVNGNAEGLRHVFVSHKGKEVLEVIQSGNVMSANYSKMALDFVDLLKKKVKSPSIVEWILPRFTTTTTTDTIVSSVTLMATMKQYFEYKMTLLCGIPEVTLLGTPEDWRDLVVRADRLRTFGDKAAVWADMLQGVLSQFVAAAEGRPDGEFWQRTCNHYAGASGPRYISGWISVFYVFDKEGQWQGDKFDLPSWVVGKPVKSDYPIIDTNQIPSGYVTVPVRINDNGEMYESLMFAGHMAMEAVTEITLSPHAGWAIVLKNDTKNLGKETHKFASEDQ